ncbi:tyrosine-type recombinase/integrase [Fimbriiglobus ruber]|uniref:Site-specific recombinase XerC n=1 Tax=Fimbriiglobus ruber TaxID=1908690 RepID=A0A225DS70_9BACT|nr:tyrosine-type recombinase/integrase [Fimbriiglobus ruber]OWK38957.1 Site-specific recombinase XerC [Fimbriiglobus ruber]
MTGELVVVNKHEDVVRLDPASIIPAIVTRAGARAEEKFAEFFAASIRNVNTRMAYLRAVTKFFAWIDAKALGLDKIRPLHVATYIELLGRDCSAPTVKQNLAAIRMLFDYLILGQVIEMNPAAAVRGPSYSAKKGKTPVLDQDETRQLLGAIDATTLVGARDRAVIGLMVYTFARVGALAAMNIEDYYAQGKRWWVRLHEKGGKLHELPCHHKLEELLDVYLEIAQLGEQKKGPLFRTATGKTGKLTVKRMTRRDVYRMVRRRATEAGIETKIGCHTFRATGITNYLENGGTLEKAQQLANHESARTTKLYDRRNDKLSLDEVERITI